MIDPVVRDHFARFSTPLEGCVDFIYADTLGLPTVAIGCLLSSPQAAAALVGWDNPGGVEADWHRVKASYQAAIEAGLRPPAYTHYLAPSSPRLSAEGIAAVVAQRLDQAGAALAAVFPSFADWPAPAQAAALSLAWACGAGWPRSWPRLSAFCQAGDWTAAGGDCAINAVGNPGVVPRNHCQRVLFELAAGVPLDEALAGIPAGPTGDAARRALAAFPFAAVGG